MEDLSAFKYYELVSWKKGSYYSDGIKELLQWSIYYNKFIHNFTIQNYNEINEYEYSEFKKLIGKLHKNTKDCAPWGSNFGG